MDKIIKILSTPLSRIIAVLLFFLVYLLLPSGFSTTDGWNYAAEIRYHGESFHPYHLLYNLTGSLFCRLPVSAGADILASLKLMNAFFAALTVLIVCLILEKAGKDNFSALSAGTFTGASFAIMRYATENETYIIPLFLGTLSLYCFISYLKSDYRKHLVLSSVFVSLSVLFHITYLFWFTGLLCGLMVLRKHRDLPWLIPAALIVPVTYLAIIFYSEGDLKAATIAGFMFDEFKAHSGLSLSHKGLFFSAASLVRSFIQVHGYMVNMLKENILSILPGTLSLIFLYAAGRRIRSLKYTEKNTRLAWVVGIIASLQFIFAVLSAGNAEFMVMLPLLFIIMVSVLFERSSTMIMLLASGMLVWNVFYGLVPLNGQSFGTEKYLAGKALDGSNNLVISSDDQRLKSIIYYETGNNNAYNVLRSPAILRLKGLDYEDLRQAIDSVLASGGGVYTDCIGKVPLSRAAISEGEAGNDFFSSYINKIVFSAPSLTGAGSVVKIEGR